METINVVGVKLKKTGKIVDFISVDFGEKIGDKVVIESDKGEDIADVIYIKKNVELDNSTDCKNNINKDIDNDTDTDNENSSDVDNNMELLSVLRIATQDDLSKLEKNNSDELIALKDCKEIIAESELSMKLLNVEYTLDRSKMIFYYTADNRVDYRALVKNLAKLYRTRIEMRQIGVRDAAKMLGGFGVCGRELCCTTFLKKFDNISIKNAKDSSNAINPHKVSGICGRLMCCLLFEREDGCCNSALEINENTYNKKSTLDSEGCKNKSSHCCKNMSIDMRDNSGEVAVNEKKANKKSGRKV